MTKTQKIIIKRSLKWQLYKCKDRIKSNKDAMKVYKSSSIMVEFYKSNIAKIKKEMLQINKIINELESEL